jgi:hypothetical protein
MEAAGSSETLAHIYKYRLGVTSQKIVIFINSAVRILLCSRLF